MSDQQERRREPIIRGRLTFLRPAERDDIPLIVRWFNDRTFTQYIASRAPMGLAFEERWYEDLLAAHGTTRWYFVICRLADGRPVGSCDLHSVDQTNGSAGIGIGIGDPADTGSGLGTDALEALLDFGFGQLRLERLHLDVYDFNRRAIRSYEKAGLTHEGVARRAIYRDGRFHDVVLMAILRDEWAERRAATPFPGPWPPDEVSPPTPPGG